jgi:RNA polymerase sigma factor (sigma-70 family)
MTPEDELFAFYKESFDPLCERLGRAFPRLANDAEDLVQHAVLQAFQDVRRNQFRPEKGWHVWVWAVAVNRARDRLRRIELKLFKRLSTAVDSSDEDRLPPGPSPSPSAAVVEKERRDRQGKMLSDILQEWCRHCEETAEGLMHKQSFERLLRGQKYEEIAAALGVPRNTLYQWRNRAYQWILERVRQTDVNRSVFMTMLGQASQGDSDSGTRQVSARSGPKSLDPPKPPADRPPVASKEMPEITRFGDVVLWVIEEMGALCPDPERLEEFARKSQGAEFSDVRYHVVEAGCRLCGVELASRP